MVGPLIKPLLVKECPDPNTPSAEAVEHDPAQMQRLQDAVSTVSSALAGIIPTGAPIPGLPIAVPGAIASAVPVTVPVPGLLSEPAAGDAEPDPAASLSTSGANEAATSGPTETGLRSNPEAPTPVAVGDPSSNNDPSSDVSSFLISSTTTVANVEEASPTQDSDYLSTEPAGTDTPMSPGVPGGPPNTPVPAASAPPS